jgi:hypothetical protein
MLNTLATKNELLRLSEAKEGDQLQFWYKGHGENADNYRNVIVSEVLRDGIVAEDLTFGGVKNFKNNQAAEVFVLESAHCGQRVRFDDARNKLVELGIMNQWIAFILTGEQLTELYGKHVVNAKCDFDEETGEIVLPSAEDVSSEGEVVFSSVEDSVMVIQRDNQTFVVESDKGTVSISTNGLWQEDVTPTQLAQELSQFILDTE